MRLVDRRGVTRIVSGTLVAGFLVGGLVTPAGAYGPLPCGITAVETGNQHSLAVGPGGSVYAWGNNAFGQVGDGSTTNRLSPVQVEGLSGITAVAGGMDHSMALAADGTVYAWGYGLAVGDGSGIHRRRPVQVPGLTGITAIAAGSNYSMALRGDGIVYAWGDNAGGPLGDGTNTDRLSPGVVPGLSGITAIAAGWHHALARGATGVVYAWGHNGQGQVGDGTSGNDRKLPAQVPGLSGITAIEADFDHSLAIGAGGTVYGWGQNDRGELGDGTTTDRPSPVQLKSMSGITALGAGTGHTLAIRAPGTVYGWGGNTYSQIGDGTTRSRLSPVQVKGLSEIVDVTAASAHSMALRADGTVYVWGNNFYGQLGDGTTTGRSKPYALSNCPNANDNFASATLISATPYSTTQSTLGVTLESGEIAPCVNAGATVWFRYTHPASAPARRMFVDTFGSGFNTTMGVWTGSAIGAIDLVACNDNARGSAQSETTWLASPGVTYSIQVAGIAAATGMVTLHLREGTLLALGDSIVAGHGLGPNPHGYPANPTTAHPAVTGADLDLRVVNMARSGDCASSPLYGHHPSTPAACIDHNVEENQIPSIPATAAPTHVVIGVGGNDIEFARCVAGFVNDDSAEMDLCRGATLADRLNAIYGNLDAVIRQVKRLSSPEPFISIVGYYNPFPPAPSEAAYDDVCDMWMVAAITRDESLSALDHSGAEFRKAVIPVQDEAYVYATDVVTGLNTTLSALAEVHGATFVETAPSFVDHDVCKRIRGGTAEETWVYGMWFSDAFSSVVAPNHDYVSRGMPASCEYLQDDSTYQVLMTGVVVTDVNGFPVPVDFRYEAIVNTNCLPHPTVAGQRAIADLVRPTLPIP